MAIRQIRRQRRRLENGFGRRPVVIDAIAELPLAVWRLALATVVALVGSARAAVVAKRVVVVGGRVLAVGGGALAGLLDHLEGTCLCGPTGHYLQGQRRQIRRQRRRHEDGFVRRPAVNNGGSKAAERRGSVADHYASLIERPREGMRSLVVLPS